jgi:hypothetical protein
MIGVLWGLYFFFLEIRSQEGVPSGGKVGWYTSRERGWMVTRHDMVVVCMCVCVYICMYQRFWRAQQVSVLECRLKEVLAHVWLKGAKCCWSVG